MGITFFPRGIEKYCKNVGRVFIVGHCPSWLSDEVIKIEKPILVSTDNNDKNKNIYRDLLYAVENSDIGVNDNGEFLISMDDHFYCRETDFNKYPFYVKDYVKRKCRHMLPLEYESGYKCANYQKLLVSTANLCTYLSYTFFYVDFIIKNQNMKKIIKRANNSLFLFIIIM